jgi:dolichol-phosphate mannosyltransferase
MRALVTGAGGFVGANLARRLVADGHDVHLVVRPDALPPWRLEGVDAPRYPADLRNAAAVGAAVRAARPQWVFHCAAYGAYSWETDAARMRATNVHGTAHLLAACRAAGFEVFVNTGSSSEYGFKRGAPAETDAAEPNSPYALSKLLATEHCAEDARRHGGAVATLRLYSVYGPYEEPARLMPAMLAAASSRLLPPLAHPATARDFVHVEDVCDAYLTVARLPPGEPGRVFNVGTGVQTTLREVVELVRGMFDVPMAPAWSSMPARSWDTDSWRADITRIRAELGWEPRHSLATGLAAFAAWLDAHPEVRARYEAALRAQVR